MDVGLTGAPATFQRYMNNLLAAVKGTEWLVYMDDVIVYSVDITKYEF